MLTALLKPGAVSDAVIQLRYLLDMHGFLRPGGPMGGQGKGNVYDQELIDSVEQFQASKALRVDGIVGPQTWDALLNMWQASSGSKLAGKGSGEDQARLETLMMATAKILYKDPAGQPNVKAVLLALADLGKREHPSGSNTGAAIAHLVKDEAGKSYYDVMGIHSNTMPPWCALAVSYWTRTALAALAEKPAASPWAPYPTWYAGAWQYEAWAQKQKGLRWRPQGVPGVRLIDMEGKPLPERPWEPGEIFVMGRAGSGSDAGGDEVVADIGTPYTGHTGLIVADMGKTVVTIEGNTSNAVCWRERKKTTLRGRVIWWHG